MSPIIVDDDLTSAQSDPNEIAASEQASAWLFPKGCEISSMSLQAIEEASMRNETHPSVVIGRIQRDTGNWSWLRAKIPKVRPYLEEAGLLA